MDVMISDDVFVSSIYHCFLRLTVIMQLQSVASESGVEWPYVALLLNMECTDWRPFCREAGNPNDAFVPGAQKNVPLLDQLSSQLP